MEFSIISSQAEKQHTACTIVAIFANKKLSLAAERLNQASDNYITKILRKGDLDGKLGKTLLLHNVTNIPSDRILLVGCGKEQELTAKQYQQIIKAIIKTILDTNISEITCYIPELAVKEQNITWKIQQTIITMQDALYTFAKYKAKKTTPKHPLQKIFLNIANKRERNQAEQALLAGLAIAKGMQYSKDLANTPPNICTPSYLAKAATSMAKTYKKINTAILAKKDLETLGMGAMLAVAQGSTQEPKLITLEYRGAKANKAPIVLVGKGVTFDSGGLSLKNPSAMVGMKYDMAGAAAVLGTLVFAAELGLAINLVGVIAAVENMPSGSACRPNDIVTSLSGTTIEIINTDAEGRLILADALTYSERFKPELVIDIATLTGACIVALGKNYSGLFSNNSALAKQLVTAGDTALDQCWQLPLTEEYQEQLHSKFADLKNMGGQEAGSIMAACFLANFSKKYHWAHLDIAGTAWDRANMDSATARPVPLLAQYLLNYSNH